jgi:ABC-type branched-subunit amino acid transport system permease subunit
LGLLVATGIGRGAGSLPAELYWELLDVNDHGVVTLGASYNRGGGTAGTYQIADVLYYASGGYYVALTLHQLWPVTVDGKPCTLVWRGDMISSAELGSLHGVERLGSESVMMKNITKTVTLFRRETKSR